jgi:DNA-binding HxlR family transcriptional regulator
MSELGCPNGEEHPPISIFHTANLVGDVWTLLIISELMGGCRRFGQLQDTLGRQASWGKTSISPKTLSQRLKFLEGNGFITREAFAEIPPRVEYRLTEKGLALSDVVKAMSDFEAKYLDDFQCEGGLFK